MVGGKEREGKGRFIMLAAAWRRWRERLLFLEVRVYGGYFAMF